MYLNAFPCTLNVPLLGLTLTWDVFKYNKGELITIWNPRLTLTWDVFKSKKRRNLKKKAYWLTLTWDVFKWNWRNF